MFRVEITSADGHKCGIPIQVDDHPSETRPYVLKAIADALLIDSDEIRAVLKDGTEEQLRAHLSQYSQDELKPFRLRQEHPQRRAFFPAPVSE
jgi:hypothetical protein